MISEVSLFIRRTGMPLSLLLVLLSSLICTRDVYACTAFSLSSNNEMVVGKNLDWHTEDGYLIVNKRNVQKAAFPTGVNQPAAWRSKYGSITFNQYGKEFPEGGINETGLVVENLTLVETEYPHDTTRATLNELQWIQYQLDNCSSIEEVVSTDSNIFVAPAYIGVHYFVADASGKSAIIEFIDGKLLCHVNKDRPYGLITNDTYYRSRQYLKTLDDFQLPNKGESLNRYQRAFELLEKYALSSDKPPVVEYAFKVLSSMASDRGSTKWSIVYDIKNLKIHYRTIKYENLKEIDVAFFDYNSSSPVVALDINTSLYGNISNDFKEYAYDMNKDLIANTLVKLGYSTSDKRFDALARYQYDLENIKFAIDDSIGKLRIIVTYLKHNNGFVQIGVMNSRDSHKHFRPYKSATVDIVNGKAKFVVYNLPFGEYSVGSYHDENGNYKYDRFLCFGKEPYAFSNNARALLGIFPPSYDKARFRFDEKEMTLHLKAK